LTERRNPNRAQSDAESPSSRQGAGAASPTHSAPIEKLVGKIVAALPLLDEKALEAALAEIKERPRASLHCLFERFTSADDAERWVIRHLLLRSADADVADDLNALIFDASQGAWVKVMANDILGELGSPVDPDVFAMSVPDPEALQAKLPSQVARKLAAGEPEAAAAHARELDANVRSIVIHEVVAALKERAVPLLQALARESERNAMSVVDAVEQNRLEAGVPLLLDLQESEGRALQKQIKRALYELRKAGVAIPETEESEPSPVERQEKGLSPYRMLIGESASRGLTVVAMSWKRPNGRLKVLTVVLDLWRRGLDDAALRADMSRSSFERFVGERLGRKMRWEEATFEQCRALIARGVRVAREFGTPLPFDFSMGKELLGDIEREAADIENPFVCSACGRPLDDASVARIRAAAPYDTMPIETRCAECRGRGGDST